LYDSRSLNKPSPREKIRVRRWFQALRQWQAQGSLVPGSNLRAVLSSLHRRFRHAHQLPQWLLELPLLAWAGLGTVIGGFYRFQHPDAADDAIVRFAFGLFLWLLAGAMFLPPAKPRSHLSSAGYKAGLVLTGALMGVAAALFGIGGSTLAVPALVLFFGVPIHRAIATAAALIVATALVGA
jgi:uncharacterized membrane protein YfcA